MLHSEFTTAVDEIEIDPRPKLKCAAAKLLARDLRDVPIEIADRLASEPLTELLERSRAAIGQGRSRDIDAALADFSFELRQNLASARQRGGTLYVATPHDEMVARAAELDDRRWNKQMIVSLLKPGAQIARISHREITLSNGETITRADERRAALNSRPAFLLRPGISEWDDDRWLKENRFPTDGQIAELEQAEESAARRTHIRTSGPKNVIGTEF